MNEKTDIDLDFVRSCFPGLSGEWTLFDNAGGSQILESVIARIAEYLRHSNVQLGASYQLSERASERVTRGAGAMAQFVNAAHPSEVVLGSSTTALIRNLASSLGRTFEKGDEIVVTNCDHEANIGAWVDLERMGLTVKFWRLDPESLQLRMEDLDRLLTRKTRIVAVTHTSNILGTINPIRDIARMVHDYGARICVDGVAYAPHRRVDVDELDVDFYALSFYKVYGPHYSMLYGKRSHLLAMPGINHFFISPEESPYHLQPGNVNYELSYGMLGLMDYINQFVEIHNRPDGPGDRLNFFFDRVARHEEQLAGKMLAFLSSCPSVKIIGERTARRDVRVPTISFVVEGRKSDHITREVDRHHIGIRYGDFYARRLIDDLGLSAQNGVVRISMVHYNSMEEVDRLIGVLDKLI